MTPDAANIDTNLSLDEGSADLGSPDLGSPVDRTLAEVSRCCVGQWICGANTTFSLTPEADGCYLSGLPGRKLIASDGTITEGGSLVGMARDAGVRVSVLYPDDTQWLFSESFASAELYDPGAGRFATTGSMATGRMGAVAWAKTSIGGFPLRRCCRSVGLHVLEVEIECVDDGVGAARGLFNVEAQAHVVTRACA